MRPLKLMHRWKRVCRIIVYRYNYYVFFRLFLKSYNRCCALCPTECLKVYPMHWPSLRETLPHFDLHFKRYECITFSCKATSFCYLGAVYSMMYPLSVHVPVSSRMLSVKITFVLKAINLQTVRHRELPDCYDFKVIVRHLTCLHSSVHTGGSHQTLCLLPAVMTHLINLLLP